MKILLINPSGTDIFASFGAQMPPLGLGYIAAYARLNGHFVKIADLSVSPGLLKKAELQQYELVGITADTARYFKAMDVAGRAKQAGLLVVMGGYHATFMDREILETGYVDVVVRGEGEKSFTDLAAALESAAPLTNLEKVKGISFIHNGKYYRNEDAEFIDNLDELPFPARDLFEMQKYKNHLAERPLASLITSRGCPFNCHFCASTRFGGRKWRFRSAKNIADEMELLYHDYGYRAFAFLDDNFTTGKNRVMQLADEIEGRKMTDILWWCFSRVDKLLNNEDMVRRMAETGAYMIFMGLESIDEDTLDHYGKKISNRQQADAVKLLRKYCIKVHGSFIVGDPAETREQISKTVEWAMKLNPESLQLSILTPYPGTMLYDKLAGEKRILHRLWNLYDGLHAVVKLDHLRPVELEKILFKSYRRFYLTPNRFAIKPPGRRNNIRQNRYVIRRIVRALKYYLAMRRFMKSNDTKNALASSSV